MQEEFDAPVWPASLEMLAELRARYTDPLTEADHESERKLSEEHGYPIRLARTGLNTISVAMLTPAIILRRLERAVREGDTDSARRRVKTYHDFMVSQGSDNERKTWMDLTYTLSTTEAG